jgi:hypothetical protein
MYPNRNPFPPQATMSLEGMASYSIKDIPTATNRVPLQRLTVIQRRYIDDRWATGRAVALHGEPGTGKTHTLLFALSELRKHRALGSRSPVALYVRADGPDPVLLYQKLMSRWTLRQMTRLAEQAFAGYAADEFIASRDLAESRDFIESHRASDQDAPAAPERLRNDPKLVKEAISDSERLRNDPELVMKAISDSELSGTAIIDRAETDIARIQGHFGSFERALRGLFNPKLRSSAHQWLIAGEVSADELERLGVSGNIDDVLQVRIGIHVLAAVAQRAGRPLTLAVDQVEAFLTTDDGRIDRANAGLLRSVVEAVVEEKGFLLAAVSADVWRNMPRDLRQRFGPSEIELLGLSPREASDMLAAYLAPWTPDAGQPRTFPFRDGAVRQLLVESGGNVRRFIEKAHEAFKATDPGPRGIDADAVTRALATTGGERSPSESDVRLAVERTLRKSGYDFRAQHVIEDHIIDYAVVQDDRVILAIEINRAVFGRDEAARAARQIETIRTLRQHQPVVILVIVGYSSPEVTDKLEEAADSVVVADRYGFESGLDEKVIEAVQASGASATVALDDRLDELRSELAALVERRNQEEQLVSARLEQISAQRLETDWQEQLRSFRRSWSLERQRIELEIDRSRSERRLADVEEVVHLHDEYRTHRRNRLRNITLLSALIVGVAAAGLSVSLYRIAAFQAWVPVVIGASVAVVLGLGSLVLMEGTRSPDQALGGKVRTIEELNRIVRQQDQTYLFSGDPYARYAALQEGRPTNPHRLASMAQQEPTAIIRRELVEQLAAEGSNGIEAVLDVSLDQASLSVAVERAGASILSSRSKLSARLQILAEISNESESRDGLRRVISAIMPDVNRKAIDRLAKAFFEKDDNLLVDALNAVHERDLRRAATELSPFEDDALGAYYWLKAIEFIDEIYLFFRKAAFFTAGGLGSPPENDSANNR